MALNIRVDGDIVILSNFARLMNDPRYVDASRDVHDLLAQGFKNYIIELAGIKETGVQLPRCAHDDHPRDSPAWR